MKHYHGTATNYDEWLDETESVEEDDDDSFLQKI